MCRECNFIFLSEGNGSLHSLMLKEFIEMVPEQVSAPVVSTARRVARPIEYEGHVEQRSY